LKFRREKVTSFPPFPIKATFIRANSNSNKQKQQQANKYKYNTRMFEARLLQASILKKILESIKDLEQANFDCTTMGISLQAMDPNHVSLISLLLRSDGFDEYRCDRNLTLGININSMAKILKCAGNDDNVTIKADDKGDVVTFMFENESMY
jgi:proliferating cell nuclear antigen PCNA